MKNQEREREMKKTSRARTEELQRMSVFVAHALLKTTPTKLRLKRKENGRPNAD